MAMQKHDHDLDPPKAVTPPPPPPMPDGGPGAAQDHSIQMSAMRNELDLALDILTSLQTAMIRLKDRLTQTP